MSPIDRIAVEYARRGVDFAAALERNYAGGFVFSTPEYFIMGRPHAGAGGHVVRGGDGGGLRAGVGHPSVADGMDRVPPV